MVTTLSSDGAAEQFVRKVVSRIEFSGPRGGRWEKLKLDCGHEFMRATKRIYPPTEVYCSQCRYPDPEPSWARKPVWLEGAGVLAATIDGRKLLIRKFSNGFEAKADEEIVGSGFDNIEVAKSELYRYLNETGPNFVFSRQLQ